MAITGDGNGADGYDTSGTGVTTGWQSAISFLSTVFVGILALLFMLYYTYVPFSIRSVTLQGDWVLSPGTLRVMEIISWPIVCVTFFCV
jgi:hypothetical protein